MTGSFSQVLLYAVLPVVGHFVGAVLAESIRTPKWVIGVSLHVAAGIAVAVVASDVMPRILPQVPLSLIAGMFLAGAFASVLLASVVTNAHRWAGGAEQGSAWMVFAAVGADLVSDGMMTGAGTAINSSLGLLIAGSQAVANIPGGFAATANLRGKSVARRMRFAMSAIMVMPVVLSAALGLWLLRDAPVVVQYSVLAFIAGVLLLATVEDIIPEADAPNPPRWISSAGFAIGFSGLMLLSGSLG